MVMLPSFGGVAVAANVFEAVMVWRQAAGACLIGWARSTGCWAALLHVALTQPINLIGIPPFEMPSLHLRENEPMETSYIGPILVIPHIPAQILQMT